MSRNKAMDLLVCYDISHPRRLRRVHKCMCHWGLPLQYSVFYCKLTLKKRRQLESELRHLINGNTDDVRVYGLKSQVPIHFLGKKPFAQDIQLLGTTALQSL